LKKEGQKTLVDHQPKMSDSSESDDLQNDFETDISLTKEAYRGKLHTRNSIVSQPEKHFDVVSTYHLRLDKIKGVSGRVSTLIQREFQIHDRIGSLISAVAANPGNLSRFLKIQYPCAMVQTLAKLDFVEKLEAATPEALVAELRAGLSQAVNSPKSRASESSLSRSRMRGENSDLSPNPTEHPRTVEQTRESGSWPARSISPTRGLNRALGPKSSLAAEGINKLNILRTRIPVKAAGLTIGSFKHTQDRTAYIIPPDDSSIGSG
jgi:hypothetical protein